MDDVHEHQLLRPDGRVVAWTECGDGEGQPLLRLPGTPGSRWSLRHDRSPWHERGLRVVTTERPEFGRSTRLPGRGFAAHADDLAAILDHLGIDRTHVMGGSGAAPHILALCARHPDRIVAATIQVGITPLRDDEIDQMIPHNVRAFRSAAAGDRNGVEAVVQPIHEAILADPVAAFASLMESAPEDDRAVMADPGARRLIDQIPTARLVEWPEDVGHLHGHHREPEILDELLGRP